MRLLAQLSRNVCSDLRELCRNAAMLPVREYVRATSTDKSISQRTAEVRAYLSCLLQMGIADIAIYRDSNCVH